MAEPRPSKPVMWVRFPSPALEPAAVAQLVEHVLGKDEVMGSSPISSSAGWRKQLRTKPAVVCQPYACALPIPQANA
jgi:hypothetical protein